MADFYQARVSWELLLKDSGRKLEDPDGHPLDLRSKYGIRPRSFDNPVVCGALGVEVTVVTLDQKAVIVKRSGMGSYLRDLYIATIGEAIHPARDKMELRDNEVLLDPFKAAVWGAKEELGIDIAPSGIRFFALGAHKTTMDPDLLGVVRVPYTQNDLEYAMLSARARDRWESRDLHFIDFYPRRVAQFIKMAGVSNMTPAAPLCLVFSLMSYFPEKQVRKAFAD